MDKPVDGTGGGGRRTHCLHWLPFCDSRRVRRSFIGLRRVLDRMIGIDRIIRLQIFFPEYQYFGVE